MTTTRQIEIFVKVAEMGSVRLTAEQLDVSQPTISKHLKSLERHVGGALFVRAPGRKVALSELGQRLLVDARQSLAARKRIGDAIALARSEEDPIMFVRGFMSEMIKSRFETLVDSGLDPRTRFVIVDDRDDIPARVKATPNSLGILRAAGLPPAEGLRQTVLKTETISLFGSVSLVERLTRGAIAPHEVTYLRHSRGSEADVWGESLLEAAGLADARREPAPQFIEVVMQKVLRGDGIGVFLDWHAQGAVQSGHLTRLTQACQVSYLVLLAHPSIGLPIYDAAV